MYKVLNQEGERLIVKTINTQIHRHLSGREFTEDDACVNIVIPESPYKWITMDEAVKQTWVYVVELNREKAIEAYKEKYGKKPSHLMKTENIIAKL